MASGQTNPPNLSKEESGMIATEAGIRLSGPSLHGELRESMKELWYSKRLSDFSLIADGKEFKTHKLLLNAHAKYFSESSGLLSKSSVTLNLKPNTLKLVLTYLYLGEVKVPAGSLQDLAAAANLLGIDSLGKQCRYALMADSALTPKNCLDIWSAARDVSEKIPAAEEALLVALENFDDLQYGPSFKALPFDHLKEYLSHSGLMVNTADQRLFAAIAWITAGADNSRMHHLLSLLELLPLRDMHTWYLKQVLHSPCVSNQPEARTYLVNVLAELSGNKPLQEPDTSPINTVSVTCDVDTHQKITMEEPLDSHHCQPWLVVLDTQMPGEIWGIQLQKDIRMMSLGKPCNIKDPVEICSEGNDIYVASITRHDRRYDQYGTRKIYAERRLLRYSIQKKSLQFVEGYNESYEFDNAATAAIWNILLCSMNNILYTIHKVAEKQQAVIKSYDLKQNPKTPTELGSMTIAISGKKPVCCTIPDDDSIVVCAALPSKDQHVLELFSVALKKTVQTLTLPRPSDHNMYSILHMASPSMFILVAGDYTAVVDMVDLRERHARKVRYSDNYIVPNVDCIVALSTDRKYIMLLGGEPKMTSPLHYYYRAPIQDVVNNTGRGWQKLHSNYPIAQGRTPKVHNIVELPADFAV